MSATVVKQMKKSAIGGTSVTLVPETDGSVGQETLPEFNFTQIVVTTAGTPPAGLWGVAAADGRKYRVTIEEYT